MIQSALIVDDDRSERRMVAGILKNRLDLESLEAGDGDQAVRMLASDKDGRIRLVILDLDMPVMNGHAALKIIGRNHPGIPVIVLTGKAGAEDAVLAMKAGAADFLSKPVNAERLVVSTRNALKMFLMSREISRLKRRVESALTFPDLVGHDCGLADSIKTGRKAAACDLPVLITGETGTGKEVFALAIHGESDRVGQPFIAVNCGAIPEKLVESTLFGHEKGAFTGAIGKSAGKFQEAAGGTIFLDEIGDLPLEAQVKLLRVLQEKKVEPVGAGKPVSVDVRIISATNRNLYEEVKAGRFREDLYFRLNVLHIDLPPLRARREDIAALADRFMEQFCAAHQVTPKEITNGALTGLQNHAWPGNVRELENVINRAMALSDEAVLRPQDFLFTNSTPADIPSPRNVIAPLLDDGTFKSFRMLEQEIIALALAHHGNNISLTARTLGIAKSTLYTKLASAEPSILNSSAPRAASSRPA